MKSSFFVLGLALILPAQPILADITERSEVRAFIREFSVKQRQAAAELEPIFKQVEFQTRIIELMNRPAESKPWWEYRKILLTEAHIQGGVDFWERNRQALEEASSRYGVAPEMIVAIIGVETRYGQVPGNYRVIDALSTLAFDYPRRSAFFRKELEQYLILCREEGIDPTLPRGSYAGAMGAPQFMPSSYRHYAVDLNGDLRRNIWTDPGDAIASVANYFAHAGWRSGEAVAFAANESDLPAAAGARRIELAGETGPEYWLTLHNFQVITRYNHSPLYAMAAYQLGREIRARHDRES
ncbi:MAG: lytic murein transglycosylase B [Methylococcaceae bacterium]|nr:lytic murein transglycosylase B [Methylococcaceae bacterium]